MAARFVVVDALHETAATFYEHHNFRRIPDTLRLVQKISDVAAALATATRLKAEAPDDTT